jgi:hypothetical protein
MPNVNYDGPIKPGLRFIWEPGKPHAHELIEVVRLNEAGDMVQNIAVDGSMYWNDVSRFREAVIPLRCRYLNGAPCTALILAACMCGSYANWCVHEQYAASCDLSAPAVRPDQGA